MNPLQRSCDRCSQLKAQCSPGEHPCARCRRLGLQCTRDRPTPTRGRPRKDQRRRRRRTSRTVSSPDSGDQTLSTSFDPATDFLLASIDLPIQRQLAASLLNRVLDIAHCVGVLGAFRQQHHKLLASVDPELIPPADREHELSFLGSRSILCALLACGTALFPVQFPETLAEDCLVYAVSDVPILTWKSRPVSRSDAYSLFLLSNFGYLQNSMTEIAVRWAMLSKMLASTALPSHADGPIELDRRIDSLACLNADVRRLLYNQPAGGEGLSPQILHGLDPSMVYPQSYSQVSPGGPLLPDSSWHHCPVGQREICIPSPAPLGQGFFDLFLPLQTALRASLSNAHRGPLTQNPVVHDLEAYFVRFPTSIMEFALVSLPWQLEAMVWFHGIYLLLTCGPDFLNCMLDPGLVHSAVFPHAIDHAILLGEVLPHLLGLEFSVSRIMPLTVYFVALSAAVHIGLLQNVYKSLPAPPVLWDSAEAHNDALTTILDVSRTCDHSAIQAVASILSQALSAHSSGTALETEQLLLHVGELQYYRWVPGGSGLLRMDHVSAQNIFHSSWLALETGDADGIGGPSEQLQAVLDPASRINQAGTFDLSILY